MLEKKQVSLEELDPKEIGSWPLEYRAVVMIIVFIGATFLSYIFILKSGLIGLSNQTTQKSKMIQEFSENYKQSANLEKYKQQMKEIEKILQSLLKKLPSKGEIPILLEDISQQASAYGLTFDLIKPEDPVDQGFYMEQPIKMVIVGKYHGFGQFAAGISQLPRIVTLHDFSIKKKSMANKDEDSLLEMQLYAKTYWYTSTSKESQN